MNHVRPGTRPRRILPIIVFSQFAGTSLWFAGNAVVDDLIRSWGLDAQSVGYVISAVQLGFISGTLVFAFTSIADRFSPRRVFLVSALLAAAASLVPLLTEGSLVSLLATRFATGFFLAGIYPVGMKIAAGWYEKGLGRALGYLVGALVLGTAFPHLVRALGAEYSYQYIMLVVSLLAASGGVAMFWLVPDGPHLAAAAKFNPKAVWHIFRRPEFRASAFGYFGHMWELYALWAFVPVWLALYVEQGRGAFDVSLWSFLIVGVGFFACSIGGVLSERVGSARVAFVQLSLSGLCCLLSPLLFQGGEWVFLGFLILWGAFVIGDSPQFSALNAANAPRKYVGSALTLVNSIGFAITIFSIELLNVARNHMDPAYLFWLLIPGPLFGLWSMRRLPAPRPG